MAASEPVRRRQCGTTRNRNNHAPVPMHHCPIPLSMSPAHFRLEVHTEHGIVLGVAKALRMAWHMAHNNSAQTKHKQNKPATAATIVRNFTHTSTHKLTAPSPKHNTNKNP